MKYMKKLSLFILACICTLGSYADLSLIHI